MLIRQDFSKKLNMPPRMFMEQIMDGLSRIYCFLWDNKNKENMFKMNWKDISVHFNKNAFRTNVRKLNNFGLISYKESDRGIAIEVVSWEEIEDDV